MAWGLCAPEEFILTDEILVPMNIKNNFDNRANIAPFFLIFIGGRRVGQRDDDRRKM